MRSSSRAHKVSAKCKTSRSSAEANSQSLASAISRKSCLTKVRFSSSFKSSSCRKVSLLKEEHLSQKVGQSVRLQPEGQSCSPTLYKSPAAAQKVLVPSAVPSIRQSRSETGQSCMHTAAREAQSYSKTHDETEHPERKSQVSSHMYIKDKVVLCTGKSSSPEKSHTSPAKFHGKSFFISVRENWKTENQKRENPKFLFGEMKKFRRRAKVEKCLNCISKSDMPTQAQVHVRTSKSTCPQQRDSLNSQSLFFLVWVLLKDDEWQSPTQDGRLNHKPKSRKVAVQSILCNVLREDISWVQSTKHLPNPNHA